MNKLTCRDVSLLISRQQEEHLTTTARLRLRFHLLICTGCRNFQNNTQLMREAFRRYLNPDKDR
jgi:hypothetical protein